MNALRANHILVLIHPGSACGSADFNIGYPQGRAARESLIQELVSWSGGVIVIDDCLSDELPGFPAFAHAIDQAMDRARNHGHISRRVAGNSPDQVALMRDIAMAMPLQGKDAKFTVTGAWYHPEDGGGSVGNVIKELTRLGCSAHLGKSAVHMEFDSDDEDLEPADDELVGKHSRPPRNRP